MADARNYMRIVISAFLSILLILSQNCIADAKARLVAVIVLRSTPSAHGRAVKASKALATRIAQEPGWDALVIESGGRLPAEAAAAIGAEIYVIGQYTDGVRPHVSGSALKVATDERLMDFSYDATATNQVPGSVSFQQIFGQRERIGLSASTAGPPATPAVVSIPSGELISVMVLSDIGSRISQEGDAFAVLTAEDFYYKGNLILPKGSPGYGVITHLKRAGNFHAGGELNFTVKRLVTPSHTDIAVETNGATADADKTTEHNGDAFGQYLLWGVGMFAKRGNDILIKKGTMFHVSTVGNDNVPVAAANARPVALDETIQVGTTGQIPATVDSAPQPEPTSEPVIRSTPPAVAASLESGRGSSVVSSGNAPVFTPPAGWSARTRNESGDITSLGFWIPGAAKNADVNISVVAQAIPEGMAPQEFAALTLQNLQNAIGSANVHVFRTMRICNGSMDGWYVESNATVGLRSIAVEQTIGLSGSESYVATYTRMQGSAEDGAARRALSSLCPGGH